jgi:hypothetical protein
MIFFTDKHIYSMSLLILFNTCIINTKNNKLKKNNSIKLEKSSNDILDNNNEMNEILPDFDIHPLLQDHNDKNIIEYKKLSEEVNKILEANNEITPEIAQNLLSKISFASHEKYFKILKNIIKNDISLISIHNFFPFLFGFYPQKLIEIQQAYKQKKYDIAIDLCLLLIRECINIENIIKLEPLKKFIDDYMETIGESILSIDKKKIFIHDGAGIVFEQLFFILLAIKDKFFCQQQYDIIEEEILKYCKQFVNVISAYKTIKQFLTNAYKKKKIIIPSFLYSAMLGISNTDIIIGVPENLIEAIIKETHDTYELFQKRNIFDDRSLKVNTNEKKNNPFLVSYFYSDETMHIGVMNDLGWTKETIMQFAQLSQLYEKQKIKNNIVLVLPYFNVFNKKIKDRKIIFSDFVTACLINRFLNKHNNFTIIPIYIPLETTPDIYGISSCAAYIGDTKNPIVIMNGCLDLFYTPIKVNAPNKKMLFEKWYKQPRDMSPYITPEIYNNNLLNQPVEGNLESFWKLLQEPLFIYGKIEDSQSQNYRIIKNEQLKREEFIIPLQKLQMIVNQDNYPAKFIVTMRSDSWGNNLGLWQFTYPQKYWNVFSIKNKDADKIF